MPRLPLKRRPLRSSRPSRVEKENRVSGQWSETFFIVIRQANGREPCFIVYDRRVEGCTIFFRFLKVQCDSEGVVIRRG